MAWRSCRLRANRLFGLVVLLVGFSPMAGIAQELDGAGLADACTSCHGKDLKGVGDVPPLAGRSPTYIARQLIDFQTGSRTGPAAAPMAMVTQSMKNDDMVALAAYIASRKP